MPGLDHGDIAPERAAVYLKSPYHCPYCGSSQIEGDSVDIDEGSAVQDVRCLECDRRWTDEYRIVNVVGHAAAGSYRPPRRDT